MFDLPPAGTPMLLDQRARPRLDSLGAEVRTALAAPDRAALGQGYDVTAGIAVIEVSGVLVPRLGIRQSLGFAIGYDGIRTNLRAALADPQVRGVAMVYNSPGGYVAGLFDLVDEVYALRGAKPIVSILDEMTASAAYALASAGDVVTMPRTGIVGSVGVIAMVMDVSRSLTKAGVTVHPVHFGRLKAMEHRASVTGVMPEALAGVQAEVDTLGELFVATVARNRGLPAGAVRAQEGACFLGAAGVAAGLADTLCAPEQAFRALLADLEVN